MSVSSDIFDIFVGNIRPDINRICIRIDLKMELKYILLYSLTNL